jgi:ketosteroid isomerase-like protein
LGDTIVALRTTFLVVLLVTIVCVLAPCQAGPNRQGGIGSGTPGSVTAQQEIQARLNAQVAAWNRGNLEGFMAAYWHSPDLTFFSNDSETHGWQPTLDRYRKRYQADQHAMGHLDFQELRIEALGPDTAFVRGRWHLNMTDGREPQGMFTLVMRYFPGEGWLIVHDHSSGK